MMEFDLVFAGESADALELIWKLIYQVISEPDGLGCFRDCSRLGCGHSSGNRCRMCDRSSDRDDTILLHDCQFFTLG